MSLRTDLLLASSLLLTSATAAAGSPAMFDFETDVRPLLAEHCLACHGPDDQQASARFDRLVGYGIASQHVWTKIHEKVLRREMPPTDGPQPTEAERQRLLSWIEDRALALRTSDATGRTRRLNRRELAAALRDVTGTSIDYAAALPGDGRVAGFDTGADGLQDAADSVERLVEVTRRAVDGIRFLEPATGTIFEAELDGVKDVKKAFDPWKADGATVKVRSAIGIAGPLLIEPKWLGERGGQEFHVPVPADGRGVLRLSLVVSTMKHDPAIPNPHLAVEVGGTAIDNREVRGTADDPDRRVYEVQCDDLPIGSKGLEVTLVNRVEMPYAVPGFENEDRTKPEDRVPGEESLFRPAFDRKEVPPEQRPVPYIVLHAITIEPRHVAAWPPRDWGVDVGELADDHLRDDEATARRLLDLWIQRAWRRPVRPGEPDRFLALFARLREQGLSFDESLRATFQSVLLSGPFRYLASPTDEDPEFAQHAIASRLSFLLTGGPPDDELRRLAAEGRLREPSVLDEQVDRLIADPRSDGFLRPFVTQWLEMEQPLTIAMSRLGQQDFRFGRYLKESMREETIAYVAEMFASNRPARELIDSDWTMMNDILAVHYGYEGVAGSRLRKFTLRPDDPRGGGLTSHAGLQSMLTWMGENWVIYRGAWTLRHLLDDPPPPPPLEVPELIPSDGENRGKSFRELLVQHQADENCTICHRDMDPLGFAFQNFDLSGRWRDVEYERYARNELDGKIEWRGEGATRPVDASGRLPRGETFENYGEFKRLAAEEYTPDLVRGLSKNLVVYAAGRQPDAIDTSDIRAIMDEQSEAGYPLRNVLKAIIRSRILLGP